jgi:hypothetical protein
MAHRERNVRPFIEMAGDQPPSHRSRGLVLPARAAVVPELPDVAPLAAEHPAMKLVVQGLECRRCELERAGADRTM